MLAMSELLGIDLTRFELLDEIAVGVAESRHHRFRVVTSLRRGSLQRRRCSGGPDVGMGCNRA